MSMLSQNSPDSSMATKRAKKTDIVSPSSAELRKAVEAIAIQPKSGKITLLTRKLFNVLLAVAQQADESGDTYRALLSDIVANAAFDSNDTALVKEHLRRMVSVQVEWSTGTSSLKPGRKWGISTLIADGSFSTSALKRTSVPAIGANKSDIAFDVSMWPTFCLNVKESPAATSQSRK